MSGPLSLFIVLLHVTAVMAFFFSLPCDDNNCGDCASSSFISSCRWCKRDNECHLPGAIFTNPCKTAEDIVEKSRCADELSRYDPELSMKMLYLSAVAYDESDDPQHPQKCLNNCLSSDNFQMNLLITKNCDIVGNSDCSGYVAVSHTLKAIVVAFRGSKNADQVFVQFIETLVAPKTSFLIGEVQTYWKRGFDLLWPSMEAELKALVSQNPSYQIWVTGHSLGGAMASLASTWLSYYNIAPRKNIILYTFGMPRVGNYDYALQHDQLVNNSWRVVNDDDLVPHFPTLLSLSIFNGPYHHGIEAFYSEEATSVYSAHRECHGKPYNEDITCSFSELTRSIGQGRSLPIVLSIPLLSTMFGPLSLFPVLLHVTVAFFFSLPCDDNNCGDCVSSSFISSCRWCRRDNECHLPGAIFTNPCKKAENIVKKSRCADKLSRYDPELSMKMLYLSAVAYDESDDPQHPQKCLNNCMSSDNFQMKLMVTKDCDIFSDSDCSGYVAVSHTLKVILVAFRGSKNFDQAFVSSLETLVTPKTSFLNGEVQTYWKRGFDALWPSMETEVKALISQNPSFQIWVTGHSLGGAMASLASTWLGYYKVAPRKNIILYTFGMPRVGNYKYALQHDQLVNNSWRVVNDDDLVPHFPSLLSVSIFNGPYHHGIEAFYSEEATSVYSAHRQCHGKPYNEDITCSFSELTRSIDKHRTYFSIPVGTFWETDCVPPSRKKREASTRDIE